MKDQAFIRGNVPMTKSEVRAVSLSKLELSETSVVYDIGAGTGSVAVEAALTAARGHVYAVERGGEAQELILLNREKFSAGALTLVRGEAPQALLPLPAPTHAFLGGGTRLLKEILDLLFEKNPSVRVVINVIALESLGRVTEEIRARGLEAEIVSVQVARAERRGGFHLMKGENPVYVISFGGGKRDGEGGGETDES